MTVNETNWHDAWEGDFVNRRRGGMLLLLLSVWLLTLLAFNAESLGGVGGMLGFVAKLKVAMRIGAAAVLGLLLIQNCQTHQARFVMRCLLPWGLFAVWSTATIAWSPLKTFSLGQLVSFCVLILLAVNVAIAWRRPRDTSMVLLQLSSCLLILNSGLILASVLRPELVSTERTGDTESVAHPTMMASSASLGLLVLLGAKVIWNWRWSRWMLVPGCTLHSVLLYEAHSRAAVAATLAAGVVLGFVCARRQFVWTALVACSFCGAAYLAIDPGLKLAADVANASADYVERDQFDSLTNLSGREEMWNVIWESYLESPVLGHGYFVSSAAGTLDVWGTMGNWTAHNMLLQVLVSTGAIGGLLFVSALWRSARSVASQRSSDPRIIRMCIALAAWYAIWGAFNESIVGPLQPECVVFFVMLGLGIGPVAATDAASKASSTPPSDLSTTASIERPAFA